MKTMNFNLCFNCSKELSEDEIDLCDECFETMKMEEWVIPGNNETGEWKTENGS